MGKTEKVSNNGKREKKDNTAAKHGKHHKRRLFPRKKGYIIALMILTLANIAFLAVLIVADLLPADLTIILSVSTVVILLIISFMFAAKYRVERIFGLLVGVVFLASMVAVTGFLSSTHETLDKISVSSLQATGPAAKEVSVVEEPFNIYITGIDQWETEKGMDLERSDVNMIVTVNPVKKQVLLTSIPRDSYVKLHTAQQMDKLTHTGVYGVDETINTVQDWLGIDLNYYVKMNFTAVRDIINAMGGIRVYSPVAFESSLRGYHYDQGWNELGGREALFFARERHAFEGQDSIRVENQQRVMKAIIEKMTSSTTLLTRYDDIMAAAGDNLSTNMSSDEMTELLKMQITDLATWDIQSQKIEGEYGEDYVASLTQSRKFSVYYTDEESVRKCKENIDSLMDTTLGDLEEASREASRSFVVNFTEMLIEKIKETKGN